jgi:hypothetical protein
LASSSFLLAFALGFKHAYDADHLLAVLNFLVRSKRVSDATRMVVSWALGHIIASTIITVAFFILTDRFEFFTVILGQLELGVAIMLVVIGVLVIFFSGILSKAPSRVHKHHHRHPIGEIHSHLQRHIFSGPTGVLDNPHPSLFSIGTIQGLASNDELYVLFLLFLAWFGIGSTKLLVGSFAIYTAGVVLGMIVFWVAVTYPLFKYGVRRLQVAINTVIGSLTVAYGLMVVARLNGFNPFGFIL